MPKSHTTEPDDHVSPQPGPYNIETEDGIVVTVESYGGLTKREYFAAKALQGMLSTPEQTTNTSVLVQLAVEAADRLIRELNR